MDTADIIQAIDTEIARLEQARTLLNGDNTTTSRGRPVSMSAFTISFYEAANRRQFPHVAVISLVRRDGLNPESGGRRAEDQTTGRP
jgi:hypothetical protein